MPNQSARPAGPPIAADEVRRYAQEVGVDLDTIGLVTGENGSITHLDVELQRTANAMFAARYF